jgi:hypothetical protein
MTKDLLAAGFLCCSKFNPETLRERTRIVRLNPPFAGCVPECGG